jgi:hypothetical protein
MAFWNGVTPDSVAAASDGFKEFVVGDNETRIKSVEEKISQSNNDMLVIVFENEDGAEIKHYIVDNEFKQQKLKQLCIAFNIPFGSQNIQSWVGKTGIVVCKKGKPNNNGTAYNQVSYLRPKAGQNINPRPTHTQQNQTTNRSSPSGNTMQGSQAEQFAREVSDDGFMDDIPF